MQYKQEECEHSTKHASWYDEHTHMFKLESLMNHNTILITHQCKAWKQEHWNQSAANLHTTQANIRRTWSAQHQLTNAPWHRHGAKYRASGVTCIGRDTQRRHAFWIQEMRFPTFHCESHNAGSERKLREKTTQRLHILIDNTKKQKWAQHRLKRCCTDGSRDRHNEKSKS